MHHRLYGGRVLHLITPIKLVIPRAHWQQAKATRTLYASQTGDAPTQAADTEVPFGSHEYGRKHYGAHMSPASSDAQKMRSPP